MHFITADGERLTTKAVVGDNLLDVVVENDLDLDGFGLSMQIFFMYSVHEYSENTFFVFTECSITGW